MLNFDWAKNELAARPIERLDAGEWNVDPAYSNASNDVQLR